MRTSLRSPYPTYRSGSEKTPPPGESGGAGPDLPVFCGERSAGFPCLSLEGDGALEAERRMPPDGVIEAVDYLATAFSACRRDCRATGQISSDWMVLKNVSTMELSKQFPRPLIEIGMPRFRSSA